MWKAQKQRQTSRAQPRKTPCATWSSRTPSTPCCTTAPSPAQHRSSFWSVFMPVVRLTCKFWISSGGWQAMNKHSAQSDQDWPPYTASRNWDTSFLTTAIIETKRKAVSKLLNMYQTSPSLPALAQQSFIMLVNLHASGQADVQMLDLSMVNIVKTANNKHSVPSQLSNRSSCWSIFMPLVVRLKCKF